MPFYEFECKKCGTHFDVRSTMKDKKKNVKKEKCPECKSQSKQEILGVSNFNFTNPVGTDRYENSHDYRWKHGYEKPGGTKDQRKYAEDNSHVGPKPYNDIDDISSGKHFGEVK